MTVDNCTQSDFHPILTDISDFWGSDRFAPGQDRVVYEKDI